jgi:hypothetical protein
MVFIKCKWKSKVSILKITDLGSNCTIKADVYLSRACVPLSISSLLFSTFGFRLSLEQRHSRSLARRTWSYKKRFLLWTGVTAVNSTEQWTLNCDLRLFIGSPSLGGSFRACWCRSFTRFRFWHHFSWGDRRDAVFECLNRRWSFPILNPHSRGVWEE